MLIRNSQHKNRRSELKAICVCVCISSSSVKLFAAQSSGVQQVSEGGPCVIGQECQYLPMDQSQQGLMPCGPNPVPGPVERVGHRRAQHVVQVDFSYQSQGLQEDEVIEKQDARG